MLTGKTPGNTRRQVVERDKELAELRARVAALPPEERAAYQSEIQAAIKAQAAARNAEDDALDNRYKR
jgi:hypothetical protein